MQALATPVASPAPAIRRKFQYTDLTGNHNKWWMIEGWQEATGMMRVRTTWARVGATPQSSLKVMPAYEIGRLITEKVGKGYREVDLHLPAPVSAVPPGISPAPRLDPKVGRLVDWIFHEAGEHIASYLACGVDALSQAQLDRGRQLLDIAQAQWDAWLASPTATTFGPLVDTVQAFYNAVPTRLPARIDPADAVRRFCGAFDEQEERLDQLAAALDTIPGTTGPDVFGQAARLARLGAQISLLPETDPAQTRIREFLHQTAVHGYRMRVGDIFALTVPEERAAFEKERRGRNHVELLCHGTANANVRHILHTGLICPRTASHGRMFGHGIYFANLASKSANYCSGSRDIPRMLFLADVALGRVFVSPTADPGRRRAPLGHDSVMGKAGVTTGLFNDEFIVYRPSQQTLRYLVTWER